ncbi:MAG TPA: cytochrome P450, partial [Ktedonobacterales bacterium]
AADLLSQLLQVRDSETGAAMSDRELRDELMTFFLAGHETTAVGLAWAWWYLAQAPEIQDTLAGEAAALGGQPSTLEELSRVPSAENVFAEALRLRPPVYMWPRRAMMEQTIGDYVVPAGTCLLVSQWVTHRDRRWWPEPERFDPGRWLPERRATQPRGAYFPFNRGARRCIGETFAWMEAQVVLATIAQRWHVSLVPGGAPIMPAARVTLRPRDGVPLFVTRRPPASQ